MIEMKLVVSYSNDMLIGKRTILFLLYDEYSGKFYYLFSFIH